MGSVVTMPTRKAASDGWPLLPSPLVGVSSEQWTSFCEVLSTSNDGKPRDIDYRSPSGALGMFAISPRRLVDLGVAHGVRERKQAGTLYVTAQFTLPHSEDRFLRNPILQRSVLTKSLKLYLDSQVQLDGMSRSGTLALLHCVGPNGISEWQKRPLAATTALVRRADGIF